MSNYQFITGQRVMLKASKRTGVITEVNINDPEIFGETWFAIELDEPVLGLRSLGAQAHQLIPEAETIEAKPAPAQEIEAALEVIEKYGVRLADIAHDAEAWRKYAVSTADTHGVIVDRTQNAIDHLAGQIRDELKRMVTQ